MFFVMCLLSLICNDSVLTWEQIMLQVIKFFIEKLENENVYFILNILF